MTLHKQLDDAETVLLGRGPCLPVEATADSVRDRGLALINIGDMLALTFVGDALLAPDDVHRAVMVRQFHVTCDALRIVRFVLEVVENIR